VGTTRGRSPGPLGRSCTGWHRCTLAVICLPWGLPRQLTSSRLGRWRRCSLTGAAISGTDYFLLRPDGIGQVNVRQRITQDDRVVASLRFLGYVVPPIPMPELPVLLSPEFVWPDLDLPMHGAAFFEDTSEEMSAATATVYGARDGAVNLGARTLRLEAVSLAPTRSAGAPVTT
jgi:hypothetical protein